MSSNTTSEDLRSVKTKKALSDAMLALLKKHSFRKITIKSICGEALISRAAFYAHFIDKYDLLKYSVTKLLSGYFEGGNDYARTERDFNCLIYENMLLLENLIYDADKETLGVLSDYILSTMNLTAEKKERRENELKNIVLSNFYIGGIIYYLFWQVKNKFPTDAPPLNKHLYEIVSIIRSM